MQYVDGFIIAVPKKNLPAYRRIAQKAAKIWREHGALEVRECLAEDVKVGKLTSFPRSVKLKRADRDRINAKVMKDPRLAEMMDPKAMPFDPKRMIFGGFEVIVAE